MWIRLGNQYQTPELNEMELIFFSLVILKAKARLVEYPLKRCGLVDNLRALGQNPTEIEVKKCGYANNPDARISFEVFIPILQTISKNRDHATFDDFVEGLKMFDKDQNGFITSAELRHILTSLGDRLSDEDVDQLFQGVEDSQGNINYEEFIKMVMNG